MMHKIEDPNGIFAKHWANIMRHHDEEDRKWEERVRKKQELIEITSTSLSAIAGKLYRAIRESNVSFDGENGPAILTMDREKWRELETFLKELENDQ